MASATMTKVEIYDAQAGVFSDIMGMGDDYPGFFSSEVAASRYAKNFLTAQGRGAMRLTTQGKPSFVLRKIGAHVIRAAA